MMTQNTPEYTTAQQTHSNQEGTVGDLIEGRFPNHHNAAATADAAGRIDVRDFRAGGPGVDEAYGIGPHFIDAAPVIPAQAAPAAPHVVAENARQDVAKVRRVGRGSGGTHVETWRLVGQFARICLEWSHEKWTEESIRRRQLRRDLLPNVRDARRAYQTAKRLDPERTDAATHRARRKLRKAKHAVPQRLPVLAAEVGAGVAGLGYLAALNLPPEAFAWTGAGLAGLAVAGFAGLATWVHLHPKKVPDFAPTEEEQHLLDRLAPEYWKEHAEERGLEGTLTGNPELGAAGIEVAIRLDGKWTLSKLLSAEENVRALLGARTGLRMQFTHGSHGGWASLALRTRSAADDDDLTWSPENRSFGIDTVTGEVVEIPLGQRILIAGMSGAGKSVASRPLLYDASEGEVNVLVILDFKKVEGRLWDHRARVASTPLDAVNLVDELIAELQYRLDVLPKGRATWTPSKGHPRITVVVDEGAEANSQASAVPVVVGYTEKGKEIVEKRDAGEGLSTLARMGRAGCIDLWWMTQKPTMSGPDFGIPSQIASQVGVRISLAVNTPTEARTVLGEDAQAKGWDAQDLPAPGVALVRYGKSKPHPIAVRFMTDEQVIALPDRRIWSLPEDSANHESPESMVPVAPAAPVPAASAPADLALVSGTGTDLGEAAAETPASKVLEALAKGPMQQKDIQASTGLPKSTLSRTVNGLISVGTLVRQDDGTVALVNSSAETGS